MVDGDHTWRVSLLQQSEAQEYPARLFESVQVAINSPDGEDWGNRAIDEFSDGRCYNHGYRAGGTWVGGWWD